MDKNPTSIFKIGGILGEKNSKSQNVGGTFFETTNEAKRPDRPRRLVLHVLYRSRVQLRKKKKRKKIKEK